jgi:hypothetical protein
MLKWTMTKANAMVPTKAAMIQTLKTQDPFETEWIERILFANGEDAFSERLIGLSVIGEVVGTNDSLEEIVKITRYYSSKINHQLSVFDMSAPDPEKGRFISVGNYRMRGDTEDLSLISDIPNPVQRKQVIDDYYMARTLGVPLFARVHANMNGVQWSYDRILVPVRTKELSVLVSAYWHHGEFATK